MEEKKLFEKGFIKKTLANKKAIKQGLINGENLQDLMVKYGYKATATV
ncbi:MAG: hypothetical protein MJZ29_06440 [Bacteroidaceae bacterium]|nr:hypothetical protein [Bacteroidaceae bacterium]